MRIKVDQVRINIGPLAICDMEEQHALFVYFCLKRTIMFRSSEEVVKYLFVVMSFRRQSHSQSSHPVKLNECCDSLKKNLAMQYGMGEGHLKKIDFLSNNKNFSVI